MYRLGQTIGITAASARSAIVALLLLFVATGPASAAANIVRTDLTGTAFVDPCTAEQITIVGGTFQLTVNTTIDAAGALHLDIRGNAQGVHAQGSTSGDMYRLAGDFWSELTVRNATYPLTMTSVEVHNAVSTGSAPNFIVHIVRHLTIDASGNVTSSVDSVSATCLG